MRKHIVPALIFFVLSGVSASVLAQEAPPPRKMPRVPVNRESVQDRRSGIPATREVQGQAIIVDGEKLKIGDIDLRLFGIVPPQLSASFGPQARTALDELTAGQNVSCLIRDRDREERFLATCRNAASTDLALELLRRGLAVTARGSIASTDLAAAYIAAEQAAEAQKAGLWSVAVPVAAAAMPAAAPAETAVTPSRPKASDEKTPAAAAKSESATFAETRAPVAAPSVIAMAPVPVAAGYAVPSEPSFVGRYQLLITGLVMLATTLGIFGAITIQRRRERRTEMQAVAAALRGELTAAHAVCRARLRSSVDSDDKDIAWPRLRSTLYQAYVGRLGWLGAELSRRVASIYGQASDYAAYYADSDETRTVAMPKRQALQTLVQHIDDVLPRLAIIEHTGNPSSAGAKPPRPVAVVVPLSTQKTSAPVTQAAARAVTSNAPVAQEKAIVRAPVIPAMIGAASFVRPSAVQIWGAIQKFARTPWIKRKPVEVRDPIAEYTALIEEEMKRFAFLEEEESGDPQLPSPTDPTPAGWSQKVHEAF